MMTSLGRFGDGRLEKGGPFFWKGCCVSASAGSACALSAARVSHHGCGARDEQSEKQAKSDVSFHRYCSLLS